MVYVRDAYAGGEGILRASLFGWFTVAEIRGNPEIATAELIRFLAEGLWYPFALLPGEGVQWDGVDTCAPRAIVSDGPTGTSLVFYFSKRDRITGGATIPTP